MNEYLRLEGLEDAVLQQISERMEISDDNATRVLFYLINNQKLLGNDESIVISKAKPKIMGMTVANEKYYINLKITTLAICALLLDIKLTKGLMSSVFSLAGIPTKAFVKLDEREGQKCILREVLMSENKMGDVRILNKFHGQCCNNDLCSCRYRSEGYCTCQPEAVEKIFQELEKNNVFRKDGAGYYHYCL